jgi:hypothetical protein
VLITDSTVRLISNLSLNGKGKSKRIIVVSVLVFTLWFSNVQPSPAMGLSIPPAPVVRVQPSYQHGSKVKIAKVIPRKKDLIAYKSAKEILFLMYLTDPILSSNQQVLELVKELRGGSWGLVGLIILIFSMGEAFVPNNPNPGWGLDRPGGSQIMAGVNPQSSREELTQLSTNVVLTQTQASGFVKNGRVDLNQAFNEVNRRASEIGCENFECSFERFEGLAT